jgi:hypothetical protein
MQRSMLPCLHLTPSHPLVRLPVHDAVMQEVRAWLLSLPPDLHKYEHALRDEGCVVAGWTEEVGGGVPAAGRSGLR